MQPATMDEVMARVKAREGGNAPAPQPAGPSPSPQPTQSETMDDVLARVKARTQGGPTGAITPNGTTGGSFAPFNPFTQGAVPGADPNSPPSIMVPPNKRGTSKIKPVVRNIDAGVQNALNAIGSGGGLPDPRDTNGQGVLAPRPSILIPRGTPRTSVKPVVRNLTAADQKTNIPGVIIPSFPSSYTYNQGKPPQANAAAQALGNPEDDTAATNYAATAGGTLPVPQATNTSKRTPAQAQQHFAAIDAATNKITDTIANIFTGAGALASQNPTAITNQIIKAAGGKVDPSLQERYANGAARALAQFVNPVTAIQGMESLVSDVATNPVGALKSATVDQVAIIANPKSTPEERAAAAVNLAAFFLMAKGGIHSVVDFAKGGRVAPMTEAAKEASGVSENAPKRFVGDNQLATPNPEPGTPVAEEPNPAPPTQAVPLERPRSPGPKRLTPEDQTPDGTVISGPREFFLRDGPVLMVDGNPSPTTELVVRGGNEPQRIVSNHDIPSALRNERQPYEITSAEFQGQNPPFYNRDKNPTTGRPVGKPYYTYPKLGKDARFGTQDEAATAIHRSIVENALAEGKPVPPLVLSEYPDLAPQPAKSPRPIVAPPNGYSPELESRYRDILSSVHSDDPKLDPKSPFYDEKLDHAVQSALNQGEFAQFEPGRAKLDLGGKEYQNPSEYGKDPSDSVHILSELGPQYKESGPRGSYQLVPVKKGIGKYGPEWVRAGKFNEPITWVTSSPEIEKFVQDYAVEHSRDLDSSFVRRKDWQAVKYNGPNSLRPLKMDEFILKDSSEGEAHKGVQIPTRLLRQLLNETHQTYLERTQKPAPIIHSPDEFASAVHHFNLPREDFYNPFRDEDGAGEVLHASIAKPSDPAIIEASRILGVTPEKVIEDANYHAINTLRAEGAPNSAATIGGRTEGSAKEIPASATESAARNITAEQSIGVPNEKETTQNENVPLGRPAGHGTESRPEVSNQTLNDGNEVVPQGKGRSAEIQGQDGKDAQTQGGIAREAGDATGLARQFEDTERAARNQSPMPTSGVSVKELADRGAQLVRDGKVDPQSLLGENRPLEPEEVAAMAHYKRGLVNDANAIQDRINGGVDEATGIKLLRDHDAIMNKLGEVDRLAQLTRGKWHELGQSLQVAFHDDYSQAALARRAKSNNLGEDISSRMAEVLKGHADQIAALQRELEATKKEALATVRDAKLPVPKGKDAIIQRIRRATFGEADRGGGTALATKRAGAIDIGRLPNQQAMKLARDAQALAKYYYENGAKTQNALMGEFAKDLPHLSEDNVYSLLSGKYDKLNRSLTEHQIEVNNAMGQIRRGAAFRAKSTLAKAASTGYDLFNGLTRNLKLSGHLSAPFMQGRKGLYVNPGAWIQSWAPMIKGLAKGDKALAAQEARFRSSPLWDKSQEAGLDLAHSHGSNAALEDEMATGLLTKAPVLGKVFQHSNATFIGFMNELRWQMFEKMAKMDPNDPAFLRSIANNVNVITGRGMGELPKAAAKAGVGNVAFSPRYTIAKAQHLLGSPLWAAETPKARAVIAGNYAKIAAANAALLLAAKQLGWGVNTDPKSSEFGKVTRNGVEYDVFPEEAELPKLIAKTFFGTVSGNGKTRPPNPAEAIGNYIEGKATPVARLPFELVGGTFLDNGQHTRGAFQKSAGKQIPFDWKQEGRNLFEPITAQSVQSAYGQGAGLPSLLNVVGQTVRAKRK